MKSRYLPVVIATFIFSVVVHASCEHDKENLRCVEYIKNYDADTITFNVPKLHPIIGQNINIRVYGVDTPEMRTKNKCEKTKAKFAQRKVEHLLKNAKKIDLVNIQRGKYFRVVADVIIDGKSLSDYLTQQGFAYKYFGGTKKKIDWCKSYRKIASENESVIMQNDLGKSNVKDLK